MDSVLQSMWFRLHFQQASHLFVLGKIEKDRLALSTMVRFIVRHIKRRSHTAGFDWFFSPLNRFSFEAVRCVWFSETAFRVPVCAQLWWTLGIEM